MQHELDTRLRVLDRFMKNTSEIDEADERKSYLCRFGTVLICGNIEQSVQIILLSRLSNRAQPRVLRFVKSHFKRGQNLDCDAAKQLLERFDIDWRDEFARLVKAGVGLEESITSAYSIRNSTAHGGTQSLGFARLRELFEAHKLFIEAFAKATER